MDASTLERGKKMLISDQHLCQGQLCFSEYPTDKLWRRISRLDALAWSRSISDVILTFYYISFYTKLLWKSFKKYCVFVLLFIIFIPCLNAFQFLLSFIIYLTQCYINQVFKLVPSESPDTWMKWNYETVSAYW